ncbi:hypothetical protein ACRQ5I_11705 [Pseudoramibacter alactolyticus]|uniref:hypothetical protein n=1 Tax=Pseudoramibacter alactolyticus TaxID=113287 RepID=UPI003D7F481B
MTLDIKEKLLWAYTAGMTVAVLCEHFAPMLKNASILLPVMLLPFILYVLDWQRTAKKNKK